MGKFNSRTFGFALFLASSALTVAVLAQPKKTPHHPWFNTKLSPDKRAELAVAAMTTDEQFALVRGYVGVTISAPGVGNIVAPAEARQSSGYVPGVPRLGIPALWETDASMGVANMFNMRKGDIATAFPSTLILAASFNPELAYRQGAVIGTEAHSKGFNVLLGGGMNLSREPRDGRTFEYLGEDPLLAGTIAGAAVRGTQAQNVVSTVKHFALNAQSTNQKMLDAKIDKGALRESDLLAFQIAIEQGQPGAVMCAYNMVNGASACNNSWLLNDVLRRDWSYRGWVMSDWSATESETYALSGLDQQSGSQMDSQPWFAEPLKKLRADGKFTDARLREMATRIVRSMFAVGLIDKQPVVRPIDYKKSAETALEVARQGIIVLKNEGGILPLADGAKRIAVIGGFANMGVPSGGGSSQVSPSNGALIKVPIAGKGLFGEAMSPILLPSAPYDAITKQFRKALVTFDAGFDTAEAAAEAKLANVAIVFVTRHSSEGRDSADLTLPLGQDALVEAVAKANPNTIVVVLTGSTITMPWADRVKGIIAGFYPGQEGAQAIAEIINGAVNPSGHLPVSFPASLDQLPRPKAPQDGVVIFRPSKVDYNEGSDVGYRWYGRNGTTPRFAFGHGLSYTNFSYDKLRVAGGQTVSVTFDITNTGARAGADVPQLYLTSADGEKTQRLIGFQRVELKPGERRSVTLKADPRLLARYDETGKAWVIKGGSYGVSLSRSSVDSVLKGEARITAQRLKP
jgi:beta-glucosidase